MSKSNASVRKCLMCRRMVKQDEFCAHCTAAFERRRDAEKMTGAQRAAEMEKRRILEIPVPLAHKRIEELVGRSVLTHEISLNWDGLVEEARSRKAPSMTDVIGLIPEDKRIIAVLPGGDD